MIAALLCLRLALKYVTGLVNIFCVCTVCVRIGLTDIGFVRLAEHFSIGFTKIAGSSTCGRSILLMRLSIYVSKIDLR